MMFFPSRANVANSYAGAPNVPVYRPSSKSPKSNPSASEPTSEVAPPTFDATNPGLYPVRTRSLGGPLSAGVVFERDPNTELKPDDIIIVTVKLSRKSRRNSFDDPLPERPPPRSFLRRMSTRLLTQADNELYKAVKMPRSEYTAHFRHDRDGNYAGTEPQRDWLEEEIVERYGKYQEMPLRHTFGGTW